MPKNKYLTIIILIVAGLAGGFYWLSQDARKTPSQEAAQSPQPQVAHAGPAPGSILRLRTPSFALSLHPLKMSDVESRQIATLLHAGLIFQNDAGEVKPVLAALWTRSGNEWRFKLRPGIQFSDGTAVTATDVVNSLCNAMQPTSPWAWALQSITRAPAADGKSVKCTGVTAPSENEISIVESKASSSLTDALSGPAGWILPSNAKEQAYGVVPGIGPYRVKEVLPDNRVVLAARAGGAIQPGVETVQFIFIADDSIAASQFLTGQLDVIDLTSPQLIDMVVDTASQNPKGGGALQQRDWDRVRILIVNDKRLAKKGFAKPLVREFINAYASAVDRERIAALSKGTAIPMISPYPPMPDIKPAAGKPGALPAARLTIVTEPDAYSDLIAASLPKAIGKVKVDYKGVDKAVLIDSLIKGDFDIASILIEATVHSADFWRSFFTPGNPFTVFGTPIEGMKNLDVETNEGKRQAGKLIAEEGNWIGVLRERRLQAAKPGVTGILFSASGQANYAFASKQ